MSFSNFHTVVRLFWFPYLPVQAVGSITTDSPVGLKEIEIRTLAGCVYNPQNQKSRFQKRKIKKNGKRFVDSLYSLIDLKTI